MPAGDVREDQSDLPALGGRGEPVQWDGPEETRSVLLHGVLGTPVGPRQALAHRLWRRRGAERCTHRV